LAFVFLWQLWLVLSKRLLLFTNASQKEEKQMRKQKTKKWTKRYWLLSETWTKAFFMSHIFGWIVATLQTIWIVWEIRRKKK
jgi:hypothetical protein